MPIICMPYGSSGSRPQDRYESRIFIFLSMEIDFCRNPLEKILVVEDCSTQIPFGVGGGAYSEMIVDAAHIVLSSIAQRWHLQPQIPWYLGMVDVEILCGHRSWPMTYVYSKIWLKSMILTLIFFKWVLKSLLIF